MIRFGMYPTIITPFQTNGAIDFISLEKIVDMFYHAGCEGIFAVCQSSEMFFLDDEEKLALAEKTLEFCRNRKMKCVISGHTQDTVSAQIKYLKMLEELRPDAVILVSNRFALHGESDETAIHNLNAICDAMAPDTGLGVYECPYPYKRLLTSGLLKAMMSDGRFRFVKDTCCEIGRIRARLSLLEGSGVKLFNANTATLFESVNSGAAGYSGIQLNLMPKFFSLLRQAFIEGDLGRAQLICQYLTCTSMVEYQNYPANAKYCMMKQELISTTTTRNGLHPLTESQMKELDAFIEVNKLALGRY